MAKVWRKCVAGGFSDSVTVMVDSFLEIRSLRTSSRAFLQPRIIDFLASAAAIFVGVRGGGGGTAVAAAAGASARKFRVLGVSIFGYDTFLFLNLALVLFFF